MTERDATTTVTGDTPRAQDLQGGRAFRDPEGAAARQSATPQAMYVDRAARCPVVRTEDGEVTLLRMGDILHVNKHHGVLQLADLLGSNRPAIPLSLDGAEHTKYRRLLDPVFTAKPRRAPGGERSRARRRADRRFRRPGRGRRVPGVV